MLDIHITEFYNDSGRIFHRLYSNFPRHITLWVDEISGLDKLDEYGMHSERHLACFSTIIWLKDEGYLRFEDIDKQQAFNHIQLTEKGYLALTGIQQTSREEDRPIDMIRLALHEKSSEIMESAVNLVITNTQ